MDNFQVLTRCVVTASERAIRLGRVYDLLVGLKKANLNILPPQLPQPPQPNRFGQDQPSQNPPLASGQLVQPGQNLSQWTQNIR